VLIADRNRIDVLAWTPDGRQLVLATDRHDYRALIAFDLGHRTVARLGGRGAAGLDIAADGDLLYVQQLYVANLWRSELPATAASLQPLTASTRYVSQPALSPDDRDLAFVSTGEGRETVWLRHLATHEEHRLPLDPALRWVRPAFSADGKALWLTGYGDDGAHAWRHDLASGRTLRADDISDKAVAVRDSPTQRIFAQPRGTHFALFRSDANGTHAVPGADAVDEFQLDGSRLGYVPADGELQLLDLDRGNAAPRRIAQVDDSHRYAWHLRGDALYFVMREGDAAILQRLDLLTNKVTALGLIAPTTVGPNLRIGADGKFAIFGRIDRVDVDLILAEP
jgi:hypothetical protein